jgi:hypothetical protein
MSEKRIPDETKARVDGIVARFNQTELRNPNVFFFTRYRGKYLYLDRDDYGHVGPRCRLTYTGDMEHWEFAIFKYSDERYDPDEWMFPGAGHIDGTVEGALKACVEAYP